MFNLLNTQNYFSLSQSTNLTIQLTGIQMKRKELNKTFYDDFKFQRCKG